MTNSPLWLIYYEAEFCDQNPNFWNEFDGEEGSSKDEDDEDD